MSNLNVATLASSPAVLLVILVIAAAVIDMRSLRIPNWLTVSGMLLGLACNTALGSPFYTGFLCALGGLATGFVIWIYTLLIPAVVSDDGTPPNWLTEGPFGLAWLKPSARAASASRCGR